MKKKLEKYKKRLLRLKKDTKQKDTPNTKLLKMAETPETRKDLVKKALFGEVLKEQIKDNLTELRTTREKRLLTNLISGKHVDKYKLWRKDDKGVVTYKRIMKSKEIRIRRKKKLTNECATAVISFYEDDSNSRLGAGKQEFITRKRERKQKRYM